MSAWGLAEEQQEAQAKQTLVKRPVVPKQSQGAGSGDGKSGAGYNVKAALAEKKGRIKGNSETLGLSNQKNRATIKWDQASRK